MAKRKITRSLPAVVRMVLTTRDASRDKPIFYEDAKRLFDEGKIVQLMGMYGDHRLCYGMPTSLDDILARREVPFSREVLACIDKAVKAGAKL